MKGSSRYNGGGSTGNVLETSIDSSPPDSRPHFKRYAGPRSAHRPFRSLVNLSSNKSARSSTDQLDFDTSRSVDVSTQMFRDGFATLNDFRLNGHMCDLELKLGTRSFACHKVVLSCTSGYFRGMFASQMKETRAPSVELHDLDHKVVDLLLQFAYTGRITLNIDNVQQVLDAASFLQFDLVVQSCSDFMKQQLHPSNCIEMRKFAEQHG